jgi:hypothetical protein
MKIRGHNSLMSLARTESDSVMSVPQDLDDFDNYRSAAFRKTQFECSLDVSTLE